MVVAGIIVISERLYHSFSLEWCFSKRRIKIHYKMKCLNNLTFFSISTGVVVSSTIGKSTVDVASACSWFFPSWKHSYHSYFYFFSRYQRKNYNNNEQQVHSWIGGDPQSVPKCFDWNWNSLAFIPVSVREFLMMDPANPSDILMYSNGRHSFIKMALEYGALVVPVLIFYI